MKKIASNASLHNLKQKLSSDGSLPQKKHNFNPAKKGQAPEKKVFERLAMGAGGPGNGPKKPLSTRNFDPLQPARRPSTTLHIKAGQKLAQTPSQASIGAAREKKTA